MNEGVLIREAATEALLQLGRPATIAEIYAEILRRRLYEFHTPTPEHVLRTTIRRHTMTVQRTDTSDLTLFTVTANEEYALIAPSKVKLQKVTGIVGIKRIHRATDKEQIIQLMTSEQLGVFREIWRLLMFAAQVGYRNSRREALSAIDSGKGIDQSTFGNNPSWPGVMFLIALADAGSADALGGAPESEERRLVAFQEYANGGLSVLQEFFASRVPSLDGLIEFIDSQQVSHVAAPDLDLAI